MGTSKNLVGNYEVDYIDSKDNMSIYYNDPQWGGLGVVNPTVFAVGFNDDFIIVKQHPNVDFKIDKGITNYFIIPLNSPITEAPEDNRIGPLTESAFMKKRKELDIPSSLNFTLEFEDLK
ncbi:hypothetical protein ACFSSE_10935 [Pedobacter alpinus]|uniref:Uncharacterized protein n=2 Tax=Pedobacter alpinus TaxID=1590643 RepID=A0ABW5TSJ0_9SPHI